MLRWWQSSPQAGALALQRALCLRGWRGNGATWRDEQQQEGSAISYVNGIGPRLNVFIFASKLDRTIGALG